MLRDHDMTIDQLGWERDTARDIGAAVDAVLGGDAAREIDVHMFDGSALIRHAAGAEPRPGVEFEIARRLRDGRDFDPSRPCDWHVVERALETRSGSSGDAEAVVGTRIVLDRSLRAPTGYAEPVA